MTLNLAWPVAVLSLVAPAASAQHVQVTDMGTLGGRWSFGRGISDLVQAYVEAGALEAAAGQSLIDAANQTIGGILGQ